MFKIVTYRKYTFRLIGYRDGTDTAANRNLLRLHKGRKGYHISMGLILGKGQCQSQLKQCQQIKMLQECRATHV